jgi:hypothetical protein
VAAAGQQPQQAQADLAVAADHQHLHARQSTDSARRSSCSTRCRPLRADLHFAGASRLEWAPHRKMERRRFLTRP